VRQLTHIPRLLWWFAGLVLALSAVARADDIKQIHPTGYVTDLAGVVNPQAKSQLEALCTELEQKTGAQMAIVTVKSLDGQEIQPYANDLFKQLGVGQKKENGGVMLLVAPNQRKHWTEVGYGLEPTITDARAGDAGRLMVPYFRQGNYSAGIVAAASQLATYIAESKGVTLTGLPARRTHQSHPAGPFSKVSVLIVLGIIVLFFILAARGGSGNYYGGGGDGGGFVSGLLIGSILGSMNRGGGWSSGSGDSGGGWGGSGGGFTGGGGGGDSGGGDFGGFGGGESGGGGAGGDW
jgi:uncharacterized protein